MSAFPLCHNVMTVEQYLQPFLCVTVKSQAELERLPGFVVNNKSTLRQSPTAGTYCQAAESSLFLWPFVAFHSNSLMTMSHLQIVLNSTGGISVLSNCLWVRSPCESALCQVGCKPIWCWCSRDSVMDSTASTLPQKGGRAQRLSFDEFYLSGVLKQSRVTRG